jgi:CheY-like chemotaxis protein
MRVGALLELLVDDSRAERRNVADQLLADGMVVLEAADGEQALTYARRLRPDVIVTELILPRLDAIGLLQAIAAEHLPIRVVVRTRQTDEQLLEWVREIGGEGLGMGEALVSAVRGASAELPTASAEGRAASGE